MTAPVSVYVLSPNAPAAVESIVRADRAGLAGAWHGHGGMFPDPMVLLGAAAARTSRITLGSSVVQMLPRHPLLLATQAIAIDQLAPGRFRLGVGLGEPALSRQQFGGAMVSPLAFTREYLSILRAVLHDGAVRFRGRYLAADATLPSPPKAPIVLGALQRQAFRLAGELADGAMMWLCPLDYVVRVAMPALADGAAAVGRPTPPLVLHAPFIVHDNADEARAAVRASPLAGFPKRPYYTAMFAAAGFPEATDGWSDRMIDAVVFHGDEATVLDRFRAARQSGVGEALAFPLAAGADRAASMERAWALLTRLANESLG